MNVFVHTCALVSDETFFFQNFLGPILRVYPGLRNMLSVENYPLLMKRAFKEKHQLVLKRYLPSPDRNKNFEAILRLTTDYGFYCPSLKVK